MHPTIIYTHTDEAPMFATFSLFPIIEAFTKPAGIHMELWDISLAGRILAAFPDYLNKDQQIKDALRELGDLVKTPEANVIKLPNISASIPQIQAAVKELQQQGYAIPDFPEDPESDQEQEIRSRYDKIKGSAVNPVLREGNSDRRAPAAVKAYARANPHPMGQWTKESKTHVASMTEGDFFGSEKSITLQSDQEFHIEYHGDDGQIIRFRDAAPLQAGEILDAAVMRQAALRDFFEEQIKDAADSGVLFSLHLKATMMKVSDPIIFGCALKVFFRDVFEKHAKILGTLGVDPNHGLQDLESKIALLPDKERKAVEECIRECYKKRPDLAMVNSERGISNLHVPSDVIIDASMPAAIRGGGKMWDANGKEQDMKAVIPDRSYAGVYQAAIDFCKIHGAFDPSTMGSVPNVGLMAQKAEEYGSHDKTFQSPGKGLFRAVNSNGEILLEQPVEEGDIFRMCQVKDKPIREWVKLAISRAQATGNPAVFWLDEARTHDAQIVLKVKEYLKKEDTSGLDISILPPAQACLHAMGRAREGQDTISVTGNVLRDYLTDLFPILELGTSAKMLSIVPLMNGGRLFETGAGGSAPKHVQQLQRENHLRWDSLGEFLALSASLEYLAQGFDNPRAAILGKTLDKATEKLLQEGRSPSRKCGELDNRGSHFYLALYWAEALASQDEDEALKDLFSEISAKLTANEDRIVGKLNAVQGTAADTGGYYKPDKKKAEALMRPSEIFNACWR